MDIFGIGAPELVFILIIALIVVGPRDLGKVGRQIGRFLNQMYRSESWKTLNEASRTLRTLPNRLAREAALEELDETVKELKHAGEQAKADASKPLTDVTQGLRAWTPGSSAAEQANRTSEEKTSVEASESETPPDKGSKE
jgi:sec-independent protein translocase protein TatB